VAALASHVASAVRYNGADYPGEKPLEVAVSITLDLPDDLERELMSEAERLGLTLPEYALRLLSVPRFVGGSAPKTGAELVAYWGAAGVIGSRPDITDSQAHARELRAKAEQRTRE
jgi:hypothetical protein